MLLFRRGGAAAVAEAASRRLGAVDLDTVLLLAFAHAASVLTCSTWRHGGGRKEPSCGRAEEADGRSHARDGEEDHDGRGRERRRSATTTTRNTHRFSACKARANNDLVVQLVVQLIFAVEVVRASSVRREGMVSTQHCV